MFASSLLITFRESLEVCLVVGVVLAFLRRSSKQEYSRYVWMGIGGGILISILIAFGLKFVATKMESAEELYEGSIMLVASAFLTWMILWMLKRRRELRGAIEQSIQTSVEQKYGIGIFLLVLLNTAREGAETVMFLYALSFEGNLVSGIAGGLIGIVVAVVIGVGIFKGVAKISLEKFFFVTSILLLLFAAGMVAHGVHELQEAGVLPFLSYPLFDLNPAVLADGSFPALHEKGAVGGVLKSLFGYNGDPSLLEGLAYVFYICAIVVLWKRVDRRFVPAAAASIAA